MGKRERVSRKPMIPVIILFVIGVSLMFSTGCGSASCARQCKTWRSDWEGGMDRTVKVYSQTGELIAEYSGKIDIETSENKVLFDVDGQRIIIYNALVIVEEIKDTEK